MATKIKPLHDRVIIRRIEDTTNQTAGGLFIPDSSKEKPQEGEVIAAGEGKYKKTVLVRLWMSKKATASCSANTAVRKLKLTAKNC